MEEGQGNLYFGEGAKENVTERIMV